MIGRPPTKQAPPFGQRLSAARRAKGLSQRQLAELLATTREVVDYYERRAQNPTLDFIERAAECLGLSPAELLGHEAAKAHKRPGPASQLQQRFERIERLPRDKQRIILAVLDTFLEGAEKA
jgi:transcriptional regulator with XRE-family HTH domain